MQHCFWFLPSNQAEVSSEVCSPDSKISEHDAARCSWASHGFAWAVPPSNHQAGYQSKRLQLHPYSRTSIFLLTRHTVWSNTKPDQVKSLETEQDVLILLLQDTKPSAVCSACPDQKLLSISKLVPEWGKVILLHHSSYQQQPWR